MNEMVNQILSSSFVLFTGVMLGLFFYSGLWWTTRKVIVNARSPLLLLGSFVLRAFVVMSGFYLIAAHDWKNLLICLSGFLIARLLVSCVLRLTKSDMTDNRQIRSHHHAPESR